MRKGTQLRDAVVGHGILLHVCISVHCYIQMKCSHKTQGALVVRECHMEVMMRTETSTPPVAQLQEGLRWTLLLTVRLQRQARLCSRAVVGGAVPLRAVLMTPWQWRTWSRVSVELHRRTAVGESLCSVIAAWCGNTRTALGSMHRNTLPLSASSVFLSRSVYLRVHSLSGLLLISPPHTAPGPSSSSSSSSLPPSLPPSLSSFSSSTAATGRSHADHLPAVHRAAVAGGDMEAH